MGDEGFSVYIVGRSHMTSAAEGERWARAGLENMTNNVKGAVKSSCS